MLGYRRGQWWVRNTGRYPIRLPGTRLLYPDEKPVPLAQGYAPLFVSGSRGVSTSWSYTSPGRTASGLRPGTRMSPGRRGCDGSQPRSGSP